MAKKKDFQMEDTLKGLEMLYEKHIESFQPGLMPDLEKQSLERKKLFDRFLGNKKAIDGNLRKEEISNLLSSNQALLQLAKQKRKQLAENIKTTSKGKRALKGYGQLNQNSKAPKVMSFKG